MENKDFEIQFSKRFENDLLQAKDWYNLQQENLGNNFYNQVAKTIETLISNPYFVVRYKSIRCLQVKKFPYLLHYTIYEDKNIIRIFGLIHTSLNPKKHWIK